jgi:hypothetical protein
MTTEVPAAPKRITIEEIRSMFGDTMPIEAAQVLWCGLFDPTTAREKLRALATPTQPNDMTRDDGLRDPRYAKHRPAPTQPAPAQQAVERELAEMQERAKWFATHFHTKDIAAELDHWCRRIRAALAAAAGTGEGWRPIETAPDMTDPAPAPQRITIEELQGMFGPSIPIEAAQVLWCGLFDPDTARQKLKEIAARPPAAEASTEAVRVALDTLVAHIVERETYVGGPEQDAFHNANVVPAEHALDRALSALSASQAALVERIKKYRAKLEVDHHFVSKAGGPMERVELPFGEDEPYDGIDCRNETIKLQDEQIAKLKARAEAAEASQAAMREAIEYAKWVIECGYSEKNMKLIYDRLDAVVPDPRAALRKLRDMMDEAGRK